MPCCVLTVNHGSSTAIVVIAAMTNMSSMPIITMRLMTARNAGGVHGAMVVCV